jgi:hypothetical protein
MTGMADEAIAPDDPRLACEGLIALRREGDWWQPWRLPPDRIETAHAPTLTERARMPAGARIGMRTDATTVSIAIDAGGDGEASPLLDIVVDGQLAHRLRVASGRTSVAAELPVGVKEVEIWLPHVVDLRIGAITLAGTARSRRRHGRGRAGSRTAARSPIVQRRPGRARHGRRWWRDRTAGG